MDSQIGYTIFLCVFGLMLRAAEADFPAIFVFGDSTLDVGNNNYLNRSKAKANFPHYGVDFPNSAATGRFSNGYNTADLLAQLLGFPSSPPPFLSLTNSSIADQMLKGISFASGGSGLLLHTGELLAVEVIPMSTQLQYFSSVVEKINASVGAQRAADLLSKSLFFISTGSNDMFEHQARPSENDTQFLASLVDSYKSHLKTLYGLGARKFSIVSVPPLGCCPAMRALNATGGCVDALNDLALQFYPMADSLLQELRDGMPGMNYSLANSFLMVSSILQGPNNFSIGEVKVACCGSGLYGQDGCNSTAPLCPDRTEHLFWDMFHPTETVSGIAAGALYAGGPPSVNPVNVWDLAQI